MENNEQICATIYHDEDVATEIVFSESFEELGELAQLDVLKDIMQEIIPMYNKTLESYQTYLGRNRDGE